MKKLNVLVLGCVVAIAASSCIKGDDFDPEAQYQIEKPIVEAYAMAHLDNPQFQEETGLWYEVIEPGDPESYQYKAVPDPNSSSQYLIEAPTVFANYTGRLVQTNTVFDSNDKDEGAEFSLARVIPGWQLVFFPEKVLYDEDGAPLEDPIIPFGTVGGVTPNGLKAGAQVRIVVPSRLAYGHQGQGSVPADAPLYFEISVLSVEAPDDSTN